MGKIRAYVYVSADGFYAGPDEDIEWFAGERGEIDADPDLSHVKHEALNTLIFGRTTYEMMRQYWSTDEAMNDDPRTTRIMRDSPKIVISKRITDLGEGPTWTNVTLMKSIDPDQVRDIQRNTLADMTILGSGTIVRQFFDLGLLDEIQIMVVPVQITAGKTLLSQTVISNLTLTETKKYQNGIISRTYSLNS